MPFAEDPCCRRSCTGRLAASPGRPRIERPQALRLGSRSSVSLASATLGPLAVDPTINLRPNRYGVLRHIWTPIRANCAAVAGLCWTIEECFQSARGETGLDYCEARSWHAWHRHMTLSMLAFAFLAGLRARLLETKTPTASSKANKRSPFAAA